MYFYNRQPASPEWKRRLPTPDAVAEHLGLQEGGSNKRAINRRWSRVPLSPPYDVWLMWKSRHLRSLKQPSEFFYKLYVSPGCEYIRDAFHATIEVLSDFEVPRFKVGKDVYGLLRPDKIVAYFWSLEELQEAANQLKRKLAACPAHGVPFTAEIADNGLLSWGIDPPLNSKYLVGRSVKAGGCG
jgi:hypothetical protein